MLLSAMMCVAGCNTIYPVGYDAGTSGPHGDGGAPGTDGGGSTVSPDDGGMIGMSTPGEIDCGMTQCMASSQVCCVPAGRGGGGGPMCIATGATCMGTTSSCDGPEDCSSGDVCCEQRGGRMGGGTTSCEAASSCTGRGDVELCHSDSDCSGSTPNCCPAVTGLPGGMGPTEATSGECEAMCPMMRGDGGFRPPRDGGFGPPPFGDGGFGPPPMDDGGLGPPPMPDGGFELPDGGIVIEVDGGDGGSVPPLPPGM